IPADADALLIVHPPQLTDAQLYAIDQYVLGGGRLLVFVDPFSEQSKNAQAAGGIGGPVRVSESSNLDRLFKAWGVEVTSDQVVADFEQAMPINVGGYGPRAIRDYIPWIMAMKAHMNGEHAVTGMLNQLTFMSAGAVSMADDATMEMTPLVISSPSSGLVDVARLKGDPDPDDLIRTTNVDDVRHVLMAEVRGVAQSAFPDGPPEGVANLGHIKQSAEDVSVIVGADADLFADRFWVSVQDYFGQSVANPFADNGSMIVNAVDFMVGSDALIGLRSRSVSRRPFTLIEGMRKEAEGLFLAEEQALQQLLQDTENRIAQLEGLKSGDQVMFSPGQETEISRFKADLATTRRALRTVQANLRGDIDHLQGRLSMFNILVMPLFLIICGTVLGAYRKRRRHNHHRKGA
ncbi:MAG: Gldg family protein, partial [Sphingomonadales bacterium]|nr:Gldg family protein [Sphingomonadales bacterium]